MSDDISLSSESTFELDIEDDSIVEYEYNPQEMIPAYDFDFDNNIRGIRIFPYDPTPPPSEWNALGQAIGRSTKIEWLRVCTYGLEEDDEIASTENLDLFIGSIANNRSLKVLILEEYDFSRARLGLLYSFIMENDSLVELSIHHCQLGLRELQMLVTAFKHRRNPTSLKNLEIVGSNIDDDSVPFINEVCSYCPRLQELGLIYNRFGIQGVQYIATLLETPECSLKYLSLGSISDMGARVLAHSLATNNKLKRLQIGHKKVTANGWEYFMGILRHKSNINATSSSNHTLCSILGRLGSGDLPEDLKLCLQFNEEMDKKKVIQNKIFYFHLNDNVDMFAEDQEILPNLLEWIGDYNPCSYDERITWKTAFYRVIKSYPGLCNYPTYDRKMRNQLEAENTTINMENARLRAENSKLKAENEELLRKIEQLTMED